MNGKIKASAAASLAVVIATGLGASPASAAAPISNGCPAGFERLSVEELTGLGYLIPGKVDRSDSGFLSFGQPGNDDGFVCGQQLHQLTFFGLPTYQFIDNTLPAAGS